MAIETLFFWKNLILALLSFNIAFWLYVTSKRKAEKEERRRERETDTKAVISTERFSQIWLQAKYGSQFLGKKEKKEKPYLTPC
jgi:uncharacterized protein YpmS